MTTWLISIPLFSAVALAAAVPLFWVARKRKQADVARRWAWGALAVGLLCATLEYSGNKAVDQCVAAGGNPETTCVDFGAVGFQLLIAGLFAAGAWWKAHFIWQN